MLLPTLVYPLYDARWEHDACGTGFLAQISGEASHHLIETALAALTNLTHRGAQDADAETSDGAGLLTQIPRTLFYEELLAQGISLANLDDLAVGMIFLPSAKRSTSAHNQSRQIIEPVCSEVGLPLLGWRDPPIDISVLGSRASATAPDIAQVLVARPRHLADEQYERSLYHARRMIEQRLQEAGIDDCYIASLSRTTIVYKGLLAPDRTGPLLSRPGRSALYQCLCPLSSTVQHQYVSFLGSGAAHASAGPQRRNQYHPGQSPLDAGTRGRHVFAAIGAANCKTCCPLFSQVAAIPRNLDNVLELSHTFRARPAAQYADAHSARLGAGCRPARGATGLV